MSDDRTPEERERKVREWAKGLPDFTSPQTLRNRAKRERKKARRGRR